MSDAGRFRVRVPSCVACRQHRPEDWETTSIDLREFITEVNLLKANQPVFREECALLLLPSSNPAVLIMWRGSAMAGQEALLFFNTDFWNDQHVEVNDLQAFVQSGQPLVDVSPEFQMDFVAVAPFSYQLRPGQGLVLVTPSPSDTPIRLGWQRSQNDGVRSLRS